MFMPEMKQSIVSPANSGVFIIKKVSYSNQQSAKGNYNSFAPIGNIKVPYNDDQKAAKQQYRGQNAMMRTKVRNADSIKAYEYGKAYHAPLKPRISQKTQTKQWQAGN